MRGSVGAVLAVISAILLTGAGIAVAVYALTGAGPSEEAKKSSDESTHVHDSHVDHEHGSYSNEAGQISSDPSVVIEYGDGGFVDSSYTVSAGETVQVKNVSDGDMYFTTGDHHNHDIHSPLNVGVVKAGGFAQFAAPDAGVYQFHNHDNEAQAGELIVQ